jgi:IclR family transcriptional regulator, KDG regulon repressor
MPAEQIQTLSRAIAVMDCFTQEHAELGVREIARMVNLSSSAAGRLLAALKEMGILSQNPDTRAYSMGVRVLSWANVYNSTLDVRIKAISAIAELHDTTLETISLYILEGDERVCIERLESPQSVRIVQRIGRRLPLYAGSAGKAILAFLPLDRQEEILTHTQLAPLTPKTITDPTILRDEIKKAREQGWAISFGEWVEDAAGVAAPILRRGGQVVGALAISGPTSRFTAENVARYCGEVKRVAAQISDSLGYNAG